MGEFTNPQGVAVTSTGEILVCDSNSQCVQVDIRVTNLTRPDIITLLHVFSTAGTLLCRWGVRGRLPGQLQRPTGIAVMKVRREGIGGWMKTNVLGWEHCRV